MKLLIICRGLVSAACREIVRSFAVFMVTAMLFPCFGWAGAQVATDYWPPFVIESAGGDLKGIDIDLMRLIGKVMHIDFEIKRYPWARCLKRIESGSSDFITGVARSSERARTIVYADVPYFSCRPAFYSLASVNGNIENYEDLHGLRIGYTSNSLYFPEFDEDTSLSKHAADSEQQLLDMLMAGRLDVIIGTDCQVEYDIARRQLADMIHKEPFSPDYRVDLYIGISRKSSWKFRIMELNRILNELVRNGTVDQIANRYFRNMNRSAQSR